MLVLSRRAGESVVIADDVVVTVLDVRGDVVRLGIDAPRHVAVHRQEVYRELQEANRAAAAADDSAGAALATLLGTGPTVRRPGPRRPGEGPPKPPPAPPSR